MSWRSITRQLELPELQGLPIFLHPMIHSRIGDFIRPSEVVAVIKGADVFNYPFPLFPAFLCKGAARNDLRLPECPIPDDMIVIGVRK
ncbi:hypothetical protein D3C71_1890280 [compost metagenome]